MDRGSGAHQSCVYSIYSQAAGGSGRCRGSLCGWPGWQQASSAVGCRGLGPRQGWWEGHGSPAALPALCWALWKVCVPLSEAGLWDELQEEKLGRWCITEQAEEGPWTSVELLVDWARLSAVAQGEVQAEPSRLGQGGGQQELNSGAAQ